MHAWTQLDAVCLYQRWGPYNRSETDAVVRTILSDDDRHVWIASVPDGLQPVGCVIGTGVGAGEAIGYVELHIVDAQSGCAEIGYGLHPDVWGRGLALTCEDALRFGRRFCLGCNRGCSAFEQEA